MKSFYILKTIFDQELFLIFIIISILLLVLFILFLIKFLVSKKENTSSEKESLIENIKISDIDKIAEEIIKQDECLKESVALGLKPISLGKSINEESILNPIEEVKETQEILDNEVLEEIKPISEEIETLKFDIDTTSYESFEEENAIINIDELSGLIKEKYSGMNPDDTQKLIDEYERDQEEKAIISYQELINNANNTTINYTEEPHGFNDPVIRKLEVKTEKTKVLVDYTNEVDFLRELKDFRVKLE